LFYIIFFALIMKLFFIGPFFSSLHTNIV